MTQARREWIQRFADPAVLSDAFAAARELMGQVCNHKPDECDCELNRFTPVEFCEWIELEVQQGRRRPVRFEPGHRPRRKDDQPPEWHLAVAG